MFEPEASKWLAIELKLAGIKQPNGRTVEASAIVRWRRELGAKSIKGSDEAFAMLVRGDEQKLHEAYPEQQPGDAPSTSEKAQLVAAFFIKRLKICGF